MRLYLLLLLISLFFLSSALDVYESLSTTSQYINAADDGTSNIIVTYYDTTSQKTVIKKYSISDGTCSDTKTFNFLYLDNSKLHYLNTMGYFILANKQSYLIKLSDLSSSLTVEMTNTSLSSNIIKGTSSFIGGGLFLVGGTTSNKGYVELFSSSTFSSSGTKTFTINGDYLSCIGIKTNSRILCFYKNSYSKEEAVILSTSLTVIRTISIDPEKDKSAYGEILKYYSFDNDQVLYCILKDGGGYLYCNIGQYTDNVNESFGNVCPISDSNNYAAVFYCNLNIKYVSVAFIRNSNVYIAMCRSSSNSKQYIFSKISFTINSEMNFVN